LNRYLHNIAIALEAVVINKVRSILTALGIIFGVAAVITMMAIGEGAKKEILDNMKLVGVNNIIISPIVKDSENNGENSEEGKETDTKKFSPGLTLGDVKAIREVLPTVSNICPVIEYETRAIKGDKSTAVTISGVSPEFFSIFNLKVSSGNFLGQNHMEQGKAVCMIGSTIRSKLFNQEDPIGKSLKCGKIWYKVIGVIQGYSSGSEKMEDLGISTYEKHVITTTNTLLLRYKDRSLVTKQGIKRSRNNKTEKIKNHNQLDKIVVQINETEKLKASGEIIKRLLLRRHSDVEDFKITIPEIQLKQEQRTKDVFKFVLVAIACISLVVGGIGIMNIMLASVMERIKEIGIRLAMGATKKDVVFQFISEATLISLSGGLFGIALGVILAKITTYIFEIPTIISLLSIFVSFGVSVAIGILFGYMPAKKAASQDPVTSLRHE